MRFNFTRLSLFKFFILNKKLAKKTLLIINFAIFLSIFSATSAGISLYIEKKISDHEFDLLELQRTQNEIHGYRTLFPVFHKSIEVTLRLDRLVNRFNLLIESTNFGDNITSGRELYFYRFHALLAYTYDLFDEDFPEIIEYTKEIIPELYALHEEGYAEAMTRNGEIFEEYYIFQKKYRDFKNNTKELEQFESLTKNELLNDKMKRAENEQILASELEVLEKHEEYYDFAWSLNNWSQDFMQLWENIYNDMMHQNKSDMRDLGKKITELSAYESQLIFLAFLLQLIIFIIIQFFEISSVIRREKK